MRGTNICTLLLAIFPHTLNNTRTVLHLLRNGLFGNGNRRGNAIEQL